jgi:hypothetical protein
MNRDVTREILWNVPPIFVNDGIAEAAGFFGFPYYLVSMIEVL